MDHTTSTATASFRHLYVLALLGVGVMGCAQPTGPEPTGEANRPEVNSEGAALQHRYIVVLQRGAGDVDAAINALAQSHEVGTIHYRYRLAIEGFAAELPAQAVEALRRHPAVARIEPDRSVTTTGSQTMAPWGLDRVNQRSLPLDRLYGYTRTGRGVTAYVVDTGILPTHVEFGTRARVGFDAMTDRRKGIDCSGHGTHVAGTIGGRTYGVAKEVALVGVRVLDCYGGGTVSSVLAGLDWAYQDFTSRSPRVPAVVNLSLGGVLTETTLDDAVERGIKLGIPHVMASGNNGNDACTFTPGRAPNGLTVGATGSTDSRAYFSNQGSCLDLFAPGVDVLSAWHSSTTATATLSGTSMAAPHVAGAVALFLEGSPAATPGEVTSVLVGNATPDVVVYAGSGSPNRLLNSMVDEPVAPPPAPSSLSAMAVSSSAIQLTWGTAAGADGYLVEQSGTLGTTVATSVTATQATISGLAAGTAYTFRVRAYGAGGYSPVAEVTATTRQVTEVRVAGLEGISEPQRSNWRAVVTIAVTTADGSSVVPGATVSGRFGSAGLQSCVTNGSGTCQITSGTFSKKVASTTFTVANITGPDLRYAANNDTVVIDRP